MKRALLPLIGLIFLSSLLGSGCKKESTSTNDPLPPQDTPTGVVNNNYLFVKPLIADVAPYYFHEQSSLTQPCQISVDETDLTKKDIYCIMDIEEFDLYFRDLDLNYNFPDGMCPYFKVRPYWFYDYEPSHGPIFEDVVVTIPAAGSATVAYTSGTYYEASAPVVVDGTGAIVSCRYDYSASEGPNCCEGTVMITVNDNSGDTATSTTTVTELGGAINNCIAGPGKDFKTNSHGYPVSTVYFRTDTNLGANEKLTLATPDSKERGGNIYRANYFDSTDYGGSSNTFPYADYTLPLGIKGPSTTAGSAPYRSGYPYYEFGCMDKAGDYIARIRVMIRSWDTISGFSSNSNPYTSGYEPQFNDRWHDATVWKDVLDGYAGGG